VARAKSLIASAKEPSPRPRCYRHPRRGRTRLLLSERGKVVVLAMRDIEFVRRQRNT